MCTNFPEQYKFTSLRLDVNTERFHPNPVTDPDVICKSVEQCDELRVALMDCLAVYGLRLKGSLTVTLQLDPPDEEQTQ